MNISNKNERIINKYLFGILVSSFVGFLAGTFVGILVGILAGTFVGILVGTFIGILVGAFVGALVCTIVGILAGTLVGTAAVVTGVGTEWLDWQFIHNNGHSGYIPSADVFMKLIIR
jgi:hypothetical protein